MPTKPHLTQADVKRLLHYDPRTGVFTWKPRQNVRKAWNTRYANKRAGYSWHPTGCKTSYWCIRIFDWPFLAHRLAFLYMTGKWPPEIVDHKDGNGLNNVWSNLRAANRAENMANSSAFRTNQLGLRGVCLKKGGDKYRATIKLKGVQKYLGHHETAAEARAAYIKEAKKHYGDFVRTDG